MRLLRTADAGDPAAARMGDGELSDEDLERLYTPLPGRHVRSDFVSSLDAAIEIEGRSGGLGGDDDHRVFATLRAVADVILVGSGTAVTENYGPAKLSQPRRARRVGRGQRPVPPIAVVSAAASLDPQSRLFTERSERSDDAAEAARPIVLCSAVASGEARRSLASVADVVECGDEHVDLHRALDALAERDLAWVLCEGGPTLNSGLIAAGLLDELCLSQAMLLAGPGHKTLSQGDSFPKAVGVRLGHLLLGDRVVLGRWELE